MRQPDCSKLNKALRAHIDRAALKSVKRKQWSSTRSELKWSFWYLRKALKRVFRQIVGGI